MPKIHNDVKVDCRSTVIFKISTLKENIKYVEKLLVNFFQFRMTSIEKFDLLLCFVHKIMLTLSPTIM